jgi:hypothetical protein
VGFSRVFLIKTTLPAIPPRARPPSPPALSGGSVLPGLAGVGSMCPRMAGVVLTSLPLPHCESSRVDRGCPGLSGALGQVLTGVDPGCPVRRGQATSPMARRGGQPRTNPDNESGLHCAPTPTLPFCVCRVDHPVARWPTGWPTDECSKTALKIGICTDKIHPLARWPMCEGGVIGPVSTAPLLMRLSSGWVCCNSLGCWPLHRRFSSTAPLLRV